jgi:hypothetical protein
MTTIPIRVAEDSRIFYLEANGDGSKDDPFTPIQELQPNQSLFPFPLFHTTEGGSDNLNVDGSFSGDPTLIYDENAQVVGGEYDTAIVQGLWDLESTLQVKSGTKSINFSDTVNGDILEFSNGGCPDCVAISGWIYLSQFNVNKNNHIVVYAIDKITKATIGNEVNIDSKIDRTKLGEYQKWAVLFSDMGISRTETSAFRIRIDSDIGPANAPDGFLDLIQLEEQGGVVFDTIFNQPPNTIFYADTIKIKYRGPLDIGINNFAEIDTLDFYNLPELSIGLSNLISSGGADIVSLNFKTIADNLKLGEANLVPVSRLPGDPVESELDIVVNFKTPYVFDSRLGDSSRLIVQDNLSSFTIFSAAYAGRLRFVTPLS